MVSAVRAHCWISGRVQGVYYRASGAHQALNLGIKGWIKNLPDGRVEAVFEGPREKVEQMIQWCHEGSPMSYVENVEVQWEDVQNKETTFVIRR